MTPPPLPKDQPDYAPGAGWLRALAGLRQNLIAARGQNQISFKRAAYDDFSRKLNAFRDLTLRYPPTVTEHLFVLTQGHPDLLQRLCRQLVSTANREGRQAMSMADLEEAKRSPPCWCGTPRLSNASETNSVGAPPAVPVSIRSSPVRSPPTARA